jgi:predicted GNAT superfamily acetyltransferase
VGAEEADGRLVGVAIGFFGIAKGPHVHSHLVAVLPEAQGRGIGRALKLGQRAACLAVGIDEVRWTYDPLLRRNAWFNLQSLGATAIRFLPEFYRPMNDLLNEGDRGDRFEVSWDLSSATVGRQLGGGGMEVPGATSGQKEGVEHGTLPLVSVIVLEAGSDNGRPVLHEPVLESADQALLAIPANYQELRQTTVALARTWRETSSVAFTRCFAAGMVATGISRDGIYLFARPPRERQSSATVEWPTPRLANS